MLTTSVFVRETGPPPVSSQMISNRLIDQMVMSKATTRMVGIRWGSTMALKVLSPSAPSMRVAS